MHVSTARATPRALLPALLSALLLTLPTCPCNAGLPARAYVWQRSWSEELRGSLREHQLSFQTLDILASELSWKNERLQREPVTSDWAFAASLGRPLCLVFRVGPCPADWSPASVETRQVVEVIRHTLQTAESAGATVAELQCDFDSATSRLENYARLLAELRRNFPGRRLSATTLPAWLEAPGFPRVLSELDAYVLQVHSLEKPRSPDAPYSLCPPEKARAWIRSAARLGKPFRVALPTYGYLLGFSADGTFRRLQAEGTPLPEPSVTRWIPVSAEPHELAALVRELKDSPPAQLESLCWFRFPSGHEERNWSWETLSLVMQGLDPAPSLILRARRERDGSFTLRVGNEGSSQGLARRVQVSWVPGVSAVADTLKGWRVLQRSRQDLTLVPETGELRIEAGETLDIGWIRLSDGALPQLRVD